MQSISSFLTQRKLGCSGSQSKAMKYGSTTAVYMTKYMVAKSQSLRNPECGCMSPRLR